MMGFRILDSRKDKKMSRMVRIVHTRIAHVAKVFTWNIVCQSPRFVAREKSFRAFRSSCGLLCSCAELFPADHFFSQQTNSPSKILDNDEAILSPLRRRNRGPRLRGILPQGAVQ